MHSRAGSWNIEQCLKTGWAEIVRLKMEYTVILEKGKSSYGAFVPDLPGCIATGESREETLSLIKEAIEFHIEGLKEDGEIIPKPYCEFERVGVTEDRGQKTAKEAS